MSLYHPFSSSLDAENDDDDDLRDVTPVNGYIISPALKPQLQSMLSFNVEWDRQTLFDASRGTIGLAWSVFKVFGTPTKESWPVSG
jgi:cyclin-dependent kinase 8/11